MSVSKARCSCASGGLSLYGITILPDITSRDICPQLLIEAVVHRSMTYSVGTLPMAFVSSRDYHRGLPLIDRSVDRRVAELEQENARLLASIQQQQHAQSPAPSDDDGLKSELEQLKRQLAETQKRERELAEKLSTVPEPEPTRDVVKMEAVEPQLPVSLRAHKGERSGASFGLMVRPFPHLPSCLPRYESFT